MKKRVVAILMATVVAVGSLAGCGSKGKNGGEASTEEGKVINIYSWNDEFRERLEAVYPEVESTSKDGTVTTLKLNKIAARWPAKAVAQLFTFSKKGSDRIVPR